MAELSQLPDVVDLKFVAGDTFRIRVRVINPADAAPVDDFEEYTFAAWIAQESGPGRSNVADFDVAPDPDAPTEAVILTLPPDETAVLPGLGDGSMFKGIWDLEVTFPNADVRTVAQGDVICYLDITHTGTAPTP